MATKLFKYLINIFYPLNCAVCGERLNPLQENVLCGTCADKLDLFNAPRCKVCGKPLPAESPDLAKICVACQREEYYFDRARALGPYSGVLEKCICRVKYHKNIRLAKNLGRIMAGYMSKSLDAHQIDVIVPVPLQPPKLRQRQFNQANLLGKAISQQFNIPINRNDLCKIKNTPSQVGLSDAQRKRNLRGAFKVKKTTKFKLKKVLLVDDVFTTGSTANECAKALKNAGAVSVTVYTLAKTTLN